MIKVSPAELCEQTRKFGSKALWQSLKELWGSCFSEKQLRELWLAKIRERRRLMASGWYVPPPKGISVLIAKKENPGRLKYDSLRKSENWPSSIVFDAKEGVLQAYASSIDKSGVVGDFGVTLYAGKDAKLIGHIKKIYKITLKAAEMVRPGLKIKDYHHQALDMFEKNGLKNITFSSTDLGEINIGHSIPGTIKPFSAKEKKVIGSLKMEEISDLISKKRIFISKKEDYVFKTGDCFTIEPRLISSENSKLPLIFFHMVVIVCQKKVKVLENFKKIFKLVGMDYLN